jgi:hypothetical protein
MKAWSWLPLALCVAALCGTALPPAQPRVPDGVPVSSPSLELLAHLPLPGPSADLWAHKEVAYVGSWYGAEEGVRLIDIADPAHPVFITTLPHRRDTSYEDVQVITTETRAFRGDLLAVGLQYATAGVEFWDVSDPREPRFLSLWRSGGHGVHELKLLQREGRVLALLACPESGLQILDATHPRRPTRLATWSLRKKLGINPGLGVWPESYLHSVSTSGDGKTAYLSYWDAGSVILDISNPAQPRYLGRTLYGAGEEANTHSTIEAGGGRLLVTTDEDTDPEPVATMLRVTAPAALAGERGGLELAFTCPLTQTGAVAGEVVYVGRAAPRALAELDLRGKFALIDAGPSSQWEDQVLRAQRAGAVAVLFSKPAPRWGSPHPEITLPGMSLPAETGSAFRKALGRRSRVTVALVAPKGAWGCVRLWDIQDRARPLPVGIFATPASGQFPAPGPGWFTAHNPVVRGDRLYVSWYADGVRVVDIGDPARPQEIAHFVPPIEAAPVESFSPTSSEEPAPDVWGVIEHHGTILLSDIRSGLWILRDLPR